MSADDRGRVTAPSGEVGRASHAQDTLARKAKMPLRFRQDAKGLEASQTLHASCVVIGESGVLIRGPSSAGKSSFATLLVAQARGRGEFGAWVADDRVVVTLRARRLIGAPHPAIAGRFEARGLGILTSPHEARAVLRLLVDLEEDVERFPALGELTARVAGAILRRLPLVAGRAGLYEACLVLDILRMRQVIESRPTPSLRVGSVGF
jgi:hypothetical protein